MVENQRKKDRTKQQHQKQKQKQLERKELGIRDLKEGTDKKRNASESNRQLGGRFWSVPTAVVKSNCSVSMATVPLNRLLVQSIIRWLENRLRRRCESITR